MAKKYKSVYTGEYDFLGEQQKKLYPPFTRYPATLPPQVALCFLMSADISKNTTRFLDPYCGTGNTLVSAVQAGIGVMDGYDINPFAVLISRARTRYVHESVIQDFMATMTDMLNETCVIESIPDMHNIDYWYDFEVAIQLGKIRAVLLPMKSHMAYPLFAVAFGELVRQFSLTRQSEFKLWRIPDITKGKSADMVMPTFYDTANRILEAYRDFYRPQLEIAEPTVMIHDGAFCPSDKQYDVVLTSPPYGDSVSTVSYGQFSLFANIWLGMNDVSARQLDKTLMGGFPANSLNDNESIRDSLQNVASINAKRALQVSSFYDDLALSIKGVSCAVAQNGYAVYVVANRRAKNIVLPTDQFVAEQFEANGFKHIVTHERVISNKTMASKSASDNIAGHTVDTMTREYIVVMQKAV